MKQITLSNGLRIFISKDDKLRSATVGIWVASGPRYETEKINGISHFIEHIVFKGSSKRTAFEIAQGMDEIGAQVNAYTTKEYTFFYTRALDYQIINAADILLDMVRFPSLPENEIETEKGVVIEEIAMCDDDPSDVCYEANERGIFSGSTMALDILGTKENVSSFTTADIREYMEKFYSPERIVIGLSGKFDEEKLLEKVKEYYGDLENKNNPRMGYEIPFNNKFTLLKRSFEQTHIMMTFEGVPIEHKDLYALQIAMFILGTGTSSKLNQRIREQLGLVYSIDSWLGRYEGGGYIAVSMSLVPKSEEQAIRETIHIISNFSKDITDKEIAIAKEKLVSSLIMSREQPQSKFSSYGYTLLLLDKFIEDDDIIDGIRSLSLDDIKSAVEKYLTLSSMSFTAVGKVKSKSEYKKIIEEAIKNA